MGLNKILIGDRIREIRENLLQETRANFAEKCDISERYMSEIERGKTMVNVFVLDKIKTMTGTSCDYILYGECNNQRLQIITNLHYIINTSDIEELQIYYKNICNFKSYMCKKLG